MSLEYEPVASVPDGLKWKPAGKSTRTVTLVSTPRSLYKIVRYLDSGAVAYYRRVEDEKSPANLSDDDHRRINAEPEPTGQVRYNVGKCCWFIHYGRWFCCEVIARTQDPNTITLRPTTGWNTTRQTPWPYEGDLTFSATSALFKFLRPLKARQS